MALKQIQVLQFGHYKHKFKPPLTQAELKAQQETKKHDTNKMKI